MATPARVTDSLKRLSGLERGRGSLATALTDSERRLEIHRLRSIIPAFILAHHDRKLQQGKPSIVPVADGVCSACHLRLPTGHVARLQSSQDLEVCDNCGTFIFLEPGPPGEPVRQDAPKPARGKRKAAQRSAH